MALGRRIRQYFRGGDLSGSAPNPTVTQARGLRETAGPTTLTMAAVTDGQFLKRDGSTITSGVPSGLTTEEVQDIVGAEIVAGTGISVNYDDGAGTVTVTSTVSGGEDDRLMRMAQVLPRARDASVNFPGLAATPSTNGTQAQNNGSTGAFHKRTSAATSGQVASWSQNSLDTLHRQFLTDITFKVRTDASLASCRIWVNIGSATMHGSSAGLGHLSAFRYATDTDGTAFWRCVTRDNATDTTTTTTLAIATDTTYILRIVESASDVKFYNHDGSTWQLLATHTTNLPSSTEDRWFNVSMTTLENVAKAISLGYIHIRHK